MKFTSTNTPPSSPAASGSGSPSRGRLCMEPELLVADEPVASLDVSIQAQIVNLFRHLQDEHGFSFLFIAHDLSMVRYLCDRVGVLLRGKLVEEAPSHELFQNPQHPYTKALLSAMPLPDPIRERSRKLVTFDAETLRDRRRDAGGSARPFCPHGRRRGSLNAKRIACKAAKAACRFSCERAGACRFSCSSSRAWPPETRSFPFTASAPKS